MTDGKSISFARIGGDLLENTRLFTMQCLMDMMELVLWSMVGSTRVITAMPPTSASSNTRRMSWCEVFCLRDVLQEQFSTGGRWPSVGVHTSLFVVWLTL